MILDAKQEFNLDLEKSILVGDKNSDIEAGKNAGIPNLFLITTGHKINSNKLNANIIHNLTEMERDF
jgi:D-glycero-D-manno-heptose 1,7-bisphosphate phosphatase